MGCGSRVYFIWLRIAIVTTWKSRRGFNVDHVKTSCKCYCVMVTRNLTSVTLFTPKHALFDWGITDRLPSLASEMGARLIAGHHSGPYPKMMTLFCVMWFTRWFTRQIWWITSYYPFCQVKAVLTCGMCLRVFKGRSETYIELNLTEGMQMYHSFSVPERTLC